MIQDALFHESFAEALRTAVMALGGFKKAGVLLWPELAADRAGRDLSDCLQDGATRKLSLEQIELLISRARAVNCHAPMVYLSDKNNYAPPAVVDPETSVQRLQREFIESQRQLSRLAEQINSKLADVAQLRKVA